MEERQDTFPRLMLHHARTRPGAPGDAREGSRHLADVDLARGRRRGSRAGLRARRRGFQARHAPRDHRRQPAAPLLGDVAAQALGGVPVPMYQDAPAAEFVYVLNNAEIDYAMVEDQEQVDKLLEAAPQVPTLAHIYYDDPRGLRNYDGVTSFERLQENGREFDRAHPGFFDAAGRAGQARRRLGDALHVGHHRQAERRVPDARGVHRRRARQRGIRPAARPTTACCRTCRWRGSATICSRLREWLYVGFTINCPESGDTVMTDLREIGPTYYFAPPRVFENLLTQVMIRMEDASAIKRWLFAHFTDVARRCGAEILDGKPGR